jgi:hypothetical protein
LSFLFLLISSGNIQHFGIRAGFRFEWLRVARGDELSDGTAGIVEIPERQRLHGARVDARGFFTLRKTGRTKVTFLHRPDLVLGIHDLFVRRESLARKILGGVRGYERSRIVGASDLAVAAADAFAGIDGYDTVRLLGGRSDWTYIGASRVVALIAQHWLEAVPCDGINSDFVLDHFAPEDTRPGSVLLFARDGAGVTTDAPLLVDYHSVSHLSSS